MGLLVFTEEELTPPETQLNSIQDTLASSSKFETTPTLAHKLSVQDLVTKVDPLGLLQHQVPVIDANKSNTTDIQVILISNTLFSGLLASYKTNSLDIDSNTKEPSFSRFNLLSHVRSYDATGQANASGSEASQCAVTTSPRTGPLGLTKPTVVYAHLVSLIGVKEHMTCDAINAAKSSALISLYSWTYTCLPNQHISLADTFKALGSTIQPLRLSNASISIPVSPSTQPDDWVRSRMMLGYSLVRYRCDTGEVQLAIQRGFLTPTKPSPIDFPPSDFGTNLALLDENTGILDITFQLAWELGRLASMADRAISAALMRVRAQAHIMVLQQAKQIRDTSFIPANTAVLNQGTAFDTLRGKVAKLPLLQEFLPGRWQKKPALPSLKSQLSFRDDHTKAQYIDLLRPGLSSLAGAVPAKRTRNVPATYNGLNSPVSSDYASILDWGKLLFLSLTLGDFTS